MRSRSQSTILFSMRPTLAKAGRRLAGARKTELISHLKSRCRLRLKEDGSVELAITLLKPRKR